MTTKTETAESLTIEQLDEILTQPCTCNKGWIPCTDHQPRTETDAEGTYVWCDTCEGTGKETCWECM